VTQSVSQAATIETWNSLARDYAQLLEKYSLFHVMAKKLLALAPVNPQQTIADVGAGTGLLAYEILKSCPDIEIHAIEPAQEMIKLVQKNVKGSNIYYHCLSAEAISTLPYRFDRIFSNATFHLVDLEQVLPSLSHVLKPSGKVVFNLWWHSLEETVAEDCSKSFRAVVEEILTQYNLTPVDNNPSRPIRNKLR
jgi:precorrin-6B methylase 2